MTEAAFVEPVEGSNEEVQPAEVAEAETDNAAAGVDADSNDERQY